MDSDLFGKIFSAASAAWAAVCMFAAALFKAWPSIMERLNERHRDIASEKAGDWDRIRTERDNACEERDAVRDRWAECEAERIEWMSRAVKAEAFLEGLGEAKQDAARIVAVERLLDAKKHQGPEGGGK